MRTSPAVILSGLLLAHIATAEDWTITDTQTKELSGKTINSVSLSGIGNLTVTSSGKSAINKMVMYRLQEGSGASFKVTSGTLDLDLTLTNPTQTRHTVIFDITQGSTLNLTASKGIAAQGLFQGSSTTLTANIEGTLQGSLINDGNSTITIKSAAKMKGNIQQTGGVLEATIEGTLEGSISFDKNVTKTSIWANQNSELTTQTSTITGNIIQQGGVSSGIIKRLNLNGSFTQTGGTSDLAFHHSLFKSNTTLSGGDTLLHFYATKLKNIISSNESKLTVNLKGDIKSGADGSSMEDYTGINSTANITLIEKSSMQNATQTSGSFTLTSNDSTVNGSITGSSQASLNINSASTQITGSITNTDGLTNIITNNRTTIGGNIVQNKGNISTSLQDSELVGGYTQIEGELIKLEMIGSKIGQGIYLERVQGNDNSIAITQKSTVNNGIKIKRVTKQITGSITDSSTINGGYTQEEAERVELSFGGDSSLQGGINVKSTQSNPTVTNPTDPSNYLTTLYFKGRSSYAGGITSSNHSIWVELDNSSTGDGAITLTKGNGYFKASGGSTFTGNLVSENTNETRVDLNSGIFKGNITQDKGKQHISLKERSTLTGSITNKDTDSTFINRSDSKMEGSYYQDNGNLDLQLGGNSVTTGSFTLNQVKTHISNGAAADFDATIQGNIHQNGGSFDGKIGGLILEGKFTQNGGTSNVTFDNKSNFHQETLIKDATKSNVTFDNNSHLKDYTIQNSGKENSLLLDRETILEGNFKLIKSSSKLGVKRGSKITGSIVSEDKENNLDFDFTGPGSEVGGDIIISNGKAGGSIEGTTIKGDLKLTDATSHFHFKNSSIRNVDILKGETLMTLDNTSITGHFNMKEKGPKNPTLKLKISNKSSIGEDLLFKNTTAFLGGDGLGNRISGSIISKDSTLSNGGAKYGGTGKAYPSSGLTVAKGIKQEGGILDLIFTNQSNIQETTIFDKTEFSHLLIQENSSLASLKVIEGKDNLVIIQGQSHQNGDITLQDTKIIIKGLVRSILSGSINATSKNSSTTLILDNSSRTGNIIQNNGDLTLNFTNNSSMQGDTILNHTKFDANLNQSSLKGSIFATKSPTTMILNNQSLYDGLIQSVNSTFDIKADRSEVAGTIDHSLTSTEDDYTFKMDFKNKSTLNNTKMTLVGNMKITSDQSVINSALGINVTVGKLDLSLDNNSSGIIAKIETKATNAINILSDRSSNNTISLIEISDQATLKINANRSSILTANLSTKIKSMASLTARGNAQLQFSITPEASSTLDISLNGGILFGKITQSAPSTGVATLASTGGFGGRWIMSDDSWLKSLTINNSSSNIADQVVMQQDSFTSPISMVDMTKDSLGNSRINLSLLPSGSAPLEGQTVARTLTLDSLSGYNGVFRVYTDLGTNQSDKLITQKASGNHTVQIYYNQATFTEDLSDKYIVITHVEDDQTEASFEGGYTDMGTQSYKSELTKVSSQSGKGFDWILGKAHNAGSNHGTNVISSILQSQYRAFSLHSETFNQRMGDLREINKAEGLWARFYTGETSTNNVQGGVKLQDIFYSTWFGYDHNQLDLKGQDFYGFALNYMLLSPKSKDYVGDIHNIGFNFYNTFIARNDFYVDIIAKYILSYGNYQINYFALNKNTPEYFNHKFLISAEIGKKFKLGYSNQRYFYLKPEAQVTSGYILGNDLEFKDNTGTSIYAHLDDTYPVLLRAGLIAGYSFDYAIKGDIALGASMIYEKNTGGKVTLNDGHNIVEYNHGGDFKMVLSAGTNWIFNDTGRIYLEAQTGFLGKTNIDYALNAGVRFTFGYKNTRRLRVPGEPPPPPPKPDYDPRNIPTIMDNTKTDIHNNKSPKAQRNSSDYFINTRKAFRDF